MQRLLFIIMLLYATAVEAQQMGAKWMTAPAASDSACQWFRRTFVADERPRRASVCIASCSPFVLYVNGRNVSTALYMPDRNPNDHQPMAITYDVTRFLRPDSNTVAVLCKEPAVAVNFFGTTVGQCRFSYSSPDGWLCHAASTSITSCGELMDGRANAQSLAYGDMMLAQWRPASVLGGNFFAVDSFAGNSKGNSQSNAVAYLGLSGESIFGYHPFSYNPLTDNAVRTYKILRPRYFDPAYRSIACNFAPGFYGFVRVTLRGCKRGERIRIGNLVYICSGEMDEQAFCRFTHQYARQIIISGDRHFNPDQIQDVEALCL